MKAHTDALVALIKTIPAFATKAFVMQVPSGTVLPYVILYPADGTDSVERATGPAVTQHPRWTMHTVGSSYSQCAAVAGLIKDKLIVNGWGVRLTVAGESCGPFWYSSPIPIQTDTDVTPALVWHTAECGFDSDPA